MRTPYDWAQASDMYIKCDQLLLRIHKCHLAENWPLESVASISPIQCLGTKTCFCIGEVSWKNDGRCHLQGVERLLCPDCPQASPQSNVTLNLMTTSFQRQRHLKSMMAWAHLMIGSSDVVTLLKTLLVRFRGLSTLGVTRSYTLS